MKTVKLHLHDGSTTTAEVVAAYLDGGARLRVPFMGEHLLVEVGPDGRAWGSNVHVDAADLYAIAPKEQPR